MSLSLKERLNNSWIWVKTHKGLVQIFVIVVLVIIIIFLLNRKEKTTTISKDNIDLIKKVKGLEDVNNKLWSDVQTYVISENEKNARIDSISRALRIKPKFIKGEDQYFYKKDTVFKGLPTTEIVTKYKDTAYRVEKHDAWLDIMAVAGKDTGSITYSNRDTLTRVEIVKTPLIGRVTRQTLIRNTSPYNVIEKGYSFSVKEKDTYLSIGPIAGVGWNGKFYPTIGIGIQYPIIKFRK